MDNPKHDGSRFCEGGCHCGQVRFRIQVPVRIKVIICNCSICQQSGYQHVNVAHRDFELLSGESELLEYRFNTGAARHLFCRHCGIKSFYQPRSHPGDWSVNLACIDLPGGVAVERIEFDGASFESNIDDLQQQVP